VSANFSETHIPFFNVYFRGKYTDFTPAWYTDVGTTLIKTMMINAFMPVIEFTNFYFMRYGFRLKDRKFTKDTYISQKKSIW
jgi:hypothetical protein